MEDGLVGNQWEVLMWSKFFGLLVDTNASGEDVVNLG